MDLLLPGAAAGLDEAAGRLCDELLASPEHLFVAHRGGERRVQVYEPLPVEAGERPVFRERGVYLITGGLGGIGLVLARHLARESRARLVLTRRTPLPPRDEWDRWLEERGKEDAASRTIAKVRELEELGAEVLVASADVADEAAMRGVVGAALERFGALHGVIHAAGVLAPASFKTVQQTTRVECEMHFHPKVYGLYVLERVLAGIDLDFCLLYSSLSAVLGGLGYVGYATANLFMDFFAHRHNRAGGSPWISVDWDSWHYQEPAEQDGKESKGGIGATLVELAVTPEEGIEAVRRVLALDGIRHIVMSTGELQPRIDQWVQLKTMKAAATAEGATVASAGTRTAAALPSGGELERRIREIWARVLPAGTIGLHDNFFDLGGNSLTGMQLIADLNRELGTDLTPVQLFDAPTVATLAGLLEPAAPEAVEESLPGPAADAAEGWEIAVIGMAGRFPGAADVDELWRNLRDGVESIRASPRRGAGRRGGRPPTARRSALRPGRAGCSTGVELFDAAFFGFTPREAEITGPAAPRCSWSAPGRRWRTPATIPRAFPGADRRLRRQQPQHLPAQQPACQPRGDRRRRRPFQVADRQRQGLAAHARLLQARPAGAERRRADRLLDLAGRRPPGLPEPARRRVRHGAGRRRRRSIAPQISGYLYEEGASLSPDGHCRAFDAKAQGHRRRQRRGRRRPQARCADALADGDTSAP